MKKNKSILITGGTGFLGSYIASSLKSDQWERVFLLSRSIKKDVILPQIVCDLSNSSQIEKVFEKYQFDIVIHTAAKAGVWGSEKSYDEINFKGTKNLLEVSQKYDVKQFIYTSTPSVVFGKDAIVNGNEGLSYPENYLTAYARSKAKAEKLVLSSHRLDFQTVSLRPHLIWGNGDNHLVPRLIERYKKSKLKQIGNGENLVDVIHVKNAAHAHLQVLKKMLEAPSFGGEAYFIGQKSPVVLWDFLKEILKLKFKDVKLKKVPSGLAYVLGYLSEKFYSLFGVQSEPLMTRFVALQLTKDHYFSHEKAIKDFGYQEIISTQEGLEELKSYVQEL